MKIITIIILVLMATAVSGQFLKGDKFLMGSFSAGGNSTDAHSGTNSSSSNKNFSIGPKMGFFINEKIAVGAGLSFSTSNYAEHYPNRSYTDAGNSLGISFFVNRYFPISDKFFFTLEGYLGAARGTNHYTDTDSSNNTTTSSDDDYSITAGVSANILFFPVKNWAIEAGIGSLAYSYSRALPDHSNTDSLGLTLNSNLTFSIAYYFRKVQ